MTSPIRIIVADDHGLFRAGLIEIFSNLNGFQVIGECGSGDEAVRLAERLSPDVLTLDAHMPGLGPAAVISALRKAAPGVATVILTMMDDPILVVELVRAGATGFVLKNATPLELSSAIRTAASGGDMVFVSISRESFNRLSYSPYSETGLLSPREQSVLALLGQAKTNRDIGKALHISDATVKRHLSNIYAKLGATSRAEALLAAQRAGMIVSRPTASS